MKITEHDIQQLKSQEAKDLAIDLLKKLESKDKNTISPGEVQVRELEYEFKLKEAEVKDHRQREAFESKIKELNLQIEKEKTKQTETHQHADDVRREHVELVEQVRQAQESLGHQLEQTTREHNLKIERLENRYDVRTAELKGEIERLETERSELRNEIVELGELKDITGDLKQLRDELQSRREDAEREFELLDEQVAAAEFERKKKTTEIQRQQELELLDLQTKHKKQILQQNEEAAIKTLDSIEKIAVDSSEWESVQAKLQHREQLQEEEVNQIRNNAIDEFRRTYNITTTDPLDVTDLFYQKRNSELQSKMLAEQNTKLEVEIKRIREHIEKEPSRIATAVEAAKVNVQNRIEQASNR